MPSQPEGADRSPDSGPARERVEPALAAAAAQDLVPDEVVQAARDTFRSRTGTPAGDTGPGRLRPDD
jgi:hypothetical protein